MMRIREMVVRGEGLSAYKPCKEPRNMPLPKKEDSAAVSVSVSTPA